jgi:hypothetical protein
MASRFTEVGNLVVKKAGFLGKTTEDLIVAQGIFFIDGHHLPHLNLLGKDAVGFQGQSISGKMRDVHLEEKLEVPMPLLGI